MTISKTNRTESMIMITPNTVEKVAKAHSKETGYRPGLMSGPLKVIINKTNAGWSARKIANWMEGGMRITRTSRSGT